MSARQASAFPVGSAPLAVRGAAFGEIGERAAVDLD